jgi:surfeit locus 1 family protein
LDYIVKEHLKMHTGKHQLRSKLLTIAVVLILSATFIFLVLQQKEQDAKQHDQQALIEQRLQAPPLLITDRVTDAEAVRYRRIKVRGTFENKFAFLLDSAVEIGQAGYYVITPLRIADTEIRILVNRGWIPLGEHRNILANVEAPASEIELMGIIDIPGKRRTVSGPAGPIGMGEPWPPLWPFLDIEKFAKSVPYTIQAFVVLEDAESPYGYLRRWSFSVRRQ